MKRYKYPKIPFSETINDDDKVMKDYIENLDKSKSEGIVLRNSDSFLLENFSKNVCKWVRKNHLQTDNSWGRKYIYNKLEGDKLNEV